MLLHISPSRPVNEVQSEFNNSFPFLKLEFFLHKTTGNHNGTRFSGKRIGDYQATIVDGSLDIYPEMKVSDLEKTLKDKFALSAQVFRRSGTLWLQTTMTDNWTLQKQNEHGMELSRVPGGTLLNREDIDTDA